MKRFLLCLMLSVLLLACCQSALANTEYIQNQVPVLYASDRNGQVTAATDDQVNTAWYCPSGDATLTMILNNVSVREIWVRNGNYAGSYNSYARPEIIAVTIHYGSNRAATYRYRMADDYAPTAVGQNWKRGYQRILLPQSFHGVYCITMTVQTARNGSVSQACVTDIVLSSGQPVVTAAPATNPPQKPVATATPQQPVVTAAPQKPQPTQVVTNGTGVVATLKQRMATRTGPGTQYDEPGSFFQAGDQVTVISKVYDARNELYWLLVEFTYKGDVLRVYTTDSRVDVNVHLIPDEGSGTQAIMANRSRGYSAPCANSIAHTDTISQGTVGKVYYQVNGYVMFEWYDDYQGLWRRGWVNAADVTWPYSY